MAQLERTAQIRSSESPQTPRAHTSAPTIEQILKGDSSFHEDPRSASTSPTSRINHESALYSPNSKKSVLSKVKERAKKLKNSLSGKRRFDINDPNNDISTSTHSWETNLHDYDDEEYEHDDAEVDPEYLGAPMYESEAAPENLKETARQHPRANPVVSEKHLCPSMTSTPVSPNKTITESVSEKLAAVSNATHSIASKFTGLAVSTTPQQPSHCSNKTTATANHLDRYGESKRSLRDEEIITQCNPDQKWDKGVSVREYFMNKLEPGEDEKALSQAITEAMSPRKTSNINHNNNTDNNGEAGGMVEKVKEAVTSLFWHDEPVSKSVNSSSVNAVPSSALGSTLQNRAALGNAYPSNAVYGARASSSRHVPVSTNNAREVAEEENHGRILQAN